MIMGRHGRIASTAKARRGLLHRGESRWLGWSWRFRCSVPAPGGFDANCRFRWVVCTNPPPRSLLGSAFTPQALRRR
jgi:hypothetical protein